MGVKIVGSISTEKKEAECSENLLQLESCDIWLSLAVIYLSPVVSVISALLWLAGVALLAW